MEQQLDWVKTLQPADDRRASWDTFVQNFQTRFLDSQRAQKAQIQLQELKMKWPEIDEYISTFESIVHEAGYNPADQNMMQLFLQGLTCSIGEKVLKDATANTYKQVKAKAISVTASQRIISAMYGHTQNNNFRRPPYQGSWQQRSFRPTAQPGPRFTRNQYNPQQN